MGDYQAEESSKLYLIFLKISHINA